ncbi:hypothetical protein PR048_028472 [Dryococelus australis]|uniref:Uncharacterized protein n=1 Tax=Dryococelus australis TaxID=614101 RepID=A0ABQ9GAQ9_9NEOP|nr:hypothetical protein PR048_028472 [Dryococelus australis]
MTPVFQASLLIKCPCVLIAINGSLTLTQLFILVIKEKGIYAQPDPYSGHPLSTQVQALALSYYLKDSNDEG